MLRSALRIAASALALVSSMSPATAQAQDTPASVACEATRESPVAVCFEPQPLTIDHCAQTLLPHFSIDVWTEPDRKPVRYRYSYQLLMNGANSGPKTVVSDRDDADAYPFTGRTEGHAAKPISYSGRASYNLRVAVFVEGRELVGFISPDTPPLEDRPHIRGLAIGISNYSYDNKSLRLNYADADATAFARALNTLLGPHADVAIEARTSDMAGTDKTLTKDAILHTLEEAVNGVQLCGPQDWYVFFFSGHGIVGVNRQEKVGRYLSTKTFDPADLTRTSIRMTDLAAKLSGTGAKNLLVVLDSCFSGFNLRPEPPGVVNGRGARSVPSAPPTATSSGKVKYVADGALRTARIEGDADSNVLHDSTVAMEQEKTRAWILTAASSDTEAEEGPVQYHGGRLVFERASVAANATKPGGHGLYTFALLSNLFAQLPRATDVSALLPGALTADGEDPLECTLDFESAASKAKEHIRKLAKDMSVELQIPEATPTKTIPPTLICVVKPPEDR